LSGIASFDYVATIEGLIQGIFRSIPRGLIFLELPAGGRTQGKIVDARQFANFKSLFDLAKAHLSLPSQMDGRSSWGGDKRGPLHRGTFEKRPRRDTSKAANGKRWNIFGAFSRRG
jgi:hypothetical protein